ncbi:hypothetical protein MMC28_006315 [Mycoblastus sanguinarius]|nr:hypothetical protein [Mycoblastus sanguinarius]
MPPKKPPKGATPETTNNQSASPQSPQDSKPSMKNSSDKANPPASVPTNSKKRKAAPKEPLTTTKNPRRSARSTRNPTSQRKLLTYLLSPTSLPLSRPPDETKSLSSLPPDTLTYSSPNLTPFAELVSATILSRPIGHTLGLRSIRTLFNAPYNFTSPRAILAAGKEGVREALEVARTQHRQKTAEELVLLARAVAERLGDGEEDVGLERVRRECGGDVEREREMIRGNVKGLGKTGLDIFGRRIQARWKEFYPFVDERTGKSLEGLGLPGSGEGLRGLLEECSGELDVGDLGEGEEERKRRAFVRISERAVGADLEGNGEKILNEAMA